MASKKSETSSSSSRTKSNALVPFNGSTSSSSSNASDSSFGPLLLTLTTFVFTFKPETRNAKTGRGRVRPKGLTRRNVRSQTRNSISMQRLSNNNNNINDFSSSSRQTSKRKRWTTPPVVTEPKIEEIFDNSEDEKKSRISDPPRKQLKMDDCNTKRNNDNNSNTLSNVGQNNPKVYGPEDEDGTYQFYQQYFSEEKAATIFEALQRECNFQQGKVRMFDRKTKKRIMIDEPRHVAYHGNKDYTYSGKTMKKQAMTPTMEFLLDQVEKLCGKRPEGAIFNLYRTGKDYISYHADKEDSLDTSMPIFSFSFGATRDFCIKFQRPEDGVAHGLEESVSLHQYKKFQLNSGSLFIMFPKFQKLYLHGVPKRANCEKARINVTVRFLK